MGKDKDEDQNQGKDQNKDGGRHNVGDDKETGKESDDFDLREYDDR